MKKKILSIAVVAAVAVAAAWGFNQSKNEMALSDVALSNVEALAGGEDASDCIIANCYWNSYNTCDYTCNGTSYRSSNMENKN